MSSEQPRKRKVDEEEQHEESLKRAKTAADVQRLRLEKLMKNPDKPVVIPQTKKEWKPPAPPEFVRNVVGSSAGAGSGEYHIYRNLRKREMLRQQFIAQTSEKETLDREYEERVEQKQKTAEEKTAKKRAKRLKRKLKAKQKPKQSEKGKEEQDGSDKDEEESSKEEASSSGIVSGGGVSHEGNQSVGDAQSSGSVGEKRSSDGETDVQTEPTVDR